VTTIELDTQDRYLTRGTGHTQLLPRTDPTVWPGIPDGPATAEDLACHESRGYHVVDGMLSPDEIRDYRRELDTLTRDPRVRADERTIVEKGSAEVRSIFDAHLFSERIGRLAADPRVLDRARQILGSDVYIHQSRINYMPGFRGNGFYWHSDFETWHAEDGMPAMRAVSLSIALTDNYPFNGGLMIVPGAHRTFIPCPGSTPAENYKTSLQQQEVGIPDQAAITKLTEEHGIDQFTGAAGAALWFDCNSLHGSANNITPFPRSNIFLVFNSVQNALVAPFAAHAARPDFVASRNFTPLTR
jgi:ectoine hydroxylase